MLMKEISAFLKRCEKAGLYHAEEHNVHRLAFLEFIENGLKYVLLTCRGAMIAS
jgi:hypothetical protein